MAQPTAYNRVNSFQSQLGTTHGTNLDSEFDAVETTLDDILTNLALIQRDDGRLSNGSVHQDAFDTTALAIMAATWTPRGEWATATQYEVGDVVEKDHSSYVCTTAHLSNVFTSDRTLGYWTTIAFAGSIDASEVVFTPAGSIAATTVQAALVELDNEKQPLDATLTALAGVTTAANKLIYATGSDAFTTTDLTAFGRSLIDDAAASDGRTTLGLGTLATLSSVDTAQITADAVTFAKMQNINTNKLLGRSTASTGDIEEITIGTGLTLAGGTLSAAASNQQLFFTPGTTYFVVPNGVTSVRVWGTGAGGAGGNSNGGTGFGGSAGGSGAWCSYANRVTIDVTGLVVCAVVVGAGGLGQAGAGQSGLAGGVSSFTGGSTITFNAGSGGTGGGGAGGAGGVATTGTTVGGVGGVGAQGSGVSGGGGGAGGGTSTAGTTNNTNGGVAGSSGVFGVGGASQAITAVGLSGTGFGAGGGGGSGGNSQGGDGRPAWIGVEWG